jgi:predicted TIM-barrel fold metal-dependent hydrolase
MKRPAEELDRWLATTPEEPLDPELEIVDPHHHFWVNEWGAYGVSDYLDDIAGNNVVASMFVECGTNYQPDVRYDESAEQGVEPGSNSVRETEYVSNIVRTNTHLRSSGLCSGVVAFANFMEGPDRLRRSIDSHIDAAQNLLKGLRQSSAWDPAIGELAYRFPPPGLLSQERFRSAFEVLKSYDLTFDAWVYFHQIPEVIDLAKDFPDVKIVINHTGGIIGINQYAAYPRQVFDLWQNYITDAGRQPNLHIKIGGLGMPSMGATFHLSESAPTSIQLAEWFQPFVSSCISKFGPERCMFESNFPVDRQYAGFTNIWNAFKICTRNLAYREKIKLFSETSKKVYNLYY